MNRMKKRFFRTVLLFFLILGTHRGYLALFDSGKTEPKQIFPCQVALLPPADQQALEEGITVRTDEQLQQLLEDYLS